MWIGVPSFADGSNSSSITSPCGSTTLVDHVPRVPVPEVALIVFVATTVPPEMTRSSNAASKVSAVPETLTGLETVESRAGVADEDRGVRSEVDVVRGARARHEREAVAAVKHDATSALLGDEDVLDARESRERRDDLTLRAARRVAQGLRERRRRGAFRRRDADERNPSGNRGRVTGGRPREQRGERAGSAGLCARNGHRYLRQRPVSVEERRRLGGSRGACGRDRESGARRGRNEELPAHNHEFARRLPIPARKSTDSDVVRSVSFPA